MSAASRLQVFDLGAQRRGAANPAGITVAKPQKAAFTPNAAYLLGSSPFCLLLLLALSRLFTPFSALFFYNCSTKIKGSKCWNFILLLLISTMGLAVVA
jgi:hypothetical protein